MTKQVKIISQKGKKERRQRRTRLKIRNTSLLPRLSVFRSSRYLSAQIIDDRQGGTLVGVSEKMLKTEKGTKTERAYALGKYLAQKAGEKKIKSGFGRGSISWPGESVGRRRTRQGSLIFDFTKGVNSNSPLNL